MWSLLHGLALILPVLLHLLVHDWYYMEFTAWARSYTYSTTPFIGSQLVLHAVYCKDIASILLVLLHLLIHDYYYVQFTEGVLLP
jgi:hypothetical protein